MLYEVITEESREEIIAQKEALLVKTVQLEAKSKELEYHKENLEELVLERTNELKEALEHVKEADVITSYSIHYTKLYETIAAIPGLIFPKSVSDT